MVQEHTPALSIGKASSQAEKSVLCQGTDFSRAEKEAARSAFLGSVAPHARHRQAVATEPLAFSHAGIVDRAKLKPPSSNSSAS